MIDGLNYHYVGPTVEYYVLGTALVCVGQRIWTPLGEKDEEGETKKKNKKRRAEIGPAHASGLHVWGARAQAISLKLDSGLGRPRAEHD